MMRLVFSLVLALAGGSEAREGCRPSAPVCGSLACQLAAHTHLAHPTLLPVQRGDGGLVARVPHCVG